MYVKIPDFIFSVGEAKLEICPVFYFDLREI